MLIKICSAAHPRWYLAAAEITSGLFSNSDARNSGKKKVAQKVSMPNTKDIPTESFKDLKARSG